MSVVLRVIVLTIALFVCFAVAGGVVGPQGVASTGGQAAAAGALLAVCFLDTLVLCPRAFTPWLIPFQILRAMLWTGIAIPVIRMMRGRWPETALTIGLLFGVVMNAQLLLPNPYMPEAVRTAHLLETASSNLIFGLFVGWLLLRPRGS